MNLLALLVRRGGVVTAAVAAGLFFGHVLSEFVPDTLGVGAAMFGAGLLAGFVLGTTAHSGSHAGSIGTVQIASTDRCARRGTKR